MGAIFKTKEQKEVEIRRQKYQREVEQSTIYFNGVRVNDALVGRLRASKDDEVVKDDIKKIKVQSTIQRPKNFPSFFDWFEYVRTEARSLLNKNKQQIEIKFEEVA